MLKLLKSQWVSDSDNHLIHLNLPQYLEVVMLYTDMTKKALKLCFEAHKEQLDKSSMPYVALA